MNDEHDICPQQHGHVGFLLIVFSRIKNTQLLGLNIMHICDVGSWSFAYHTNI